MTAEQAYTRYVVRGALHLKPGGMAPFINDAHIDLGYRYRSAAVISRGRRRRRAYRGSATDARPPRDAAAARRRRARRRTGLDDRPGRNAASRSLPDRTVRRGPPPRDEAWAAAGVPCDVYRAGEALHDPGGALPAALGISPGGAVLVTPRRGGGLAIRCAGLRRRRVGDHGARRRSDAGAARRCGARRPRVECHVCVTPSGSRSPSWPPRSAACPRGRITRSRPSDDANQPITLQGQIARIDLVNPHAWLYLEVKDADGTVVRWNVEMGAPNNLIRRGVTKATLPIGES